MGATRWRRTIPVGLFLVALLVRATRACQEPVVNPDAIRFIEQAQALWANPLAAIRGEPYHPLHSAAGLLVHSLTARLFSDDRMAWLWAMQSVGVVAGAIVALLIFQLSRRLGAPFWAALLAALLWVVGRRTSAYGADGLSDTLCLAFFGGAMLLAMPALPPARRPGRWRFFAAGLLSGLAYLTRPEGLGAALILIATVTLLSLPRRRIDLLACLPRLLQRWLRPSEQARKLFPCRRASPPAALVSGALLLAGALIVGVWYMLAIGGLTQKKSLVLASGAAPQLAGNLLGTLLDGRAWYKIVMELWETCGFAPILVCALALIWRPHFWGRPRYRLLACVWIAGWLMLMLWLIARTRTPEEPDGYLDGRHTLPLQLLLHSLFALAMVAWRRPMLLWQGYWRRRPVWARLPAPLRWSGWPNLAGMIAGLLGMLPGLLMLREPPMVDKFYMREAAAWMASRYAPDTVVFQADRRVAYYAGLKYVFWGGTPRAPDLPPAAYSAALPVVLAYIYQADEKVEPSISHEGATFVLQMKFRSKRALHRDVLAIYERKTVPR